MTTSEKNRNTRIQQVLDAALETAKKRYNEADKFKKVWMLTNAAARLALLQAQGKLTADFDINSTVGELLKNATASILLGNSVTAGDPKLKKMVLDETYGLKNVGDLLDPKAKEYYKGANIYRPHLRVLDTDPTNPDYAANYWKQFREAFQKMALG